MKVLVTGTQGQIARSLQEVAGQSGHNIVAVGRPDLDLAEPSTIEPAIVAAAPALVVSAGAYTGVDRAESEPQVVRAINGDGPGIVAATCAKLRIPIIHMSTDYVLDGAKAIPYVESDPAGPLNIYGHSKLYGECQVAANCRHHVILRTSWLYGPFGHNFVKTMLRLAKTRSEIGVVNDQTGSPTYTLHLAQAILTIALRLVSEPERDRIAGIYNVAAVGATTWYGFAEEIFRCSRSLGGPIARVHPIVTCAYPTPARRPANSRLDSTKVERVFGISLPSWVEGTRDCVARLVRPAIREAEGWEQ